MAFFFFASLTNTTCTCEWQQGLKEITVLTSALFFTFSHAATVTDSCCRDACTFTTGCHSHRYTHRITACVHTASTHRIYSQCSRLTQYWVVFNLFDPSAVFARISLAVLTGFQPSLPDLVRHPMCCCSQNKRMFKYKIFKSTGRNVIAGNVSFIPGGALFLNCTGTSWLWHRSLCVVRFQLQTHFGWWKSVDLVKYWESKYLVLYHCWLFQ